MGKTVCGGYSFCDDTVALENERIKAGDSLPKEEDDGDDDDGTDDTDDLQVHQEVRQGCDAKIRVM